MFMRKKKSDVATYVANLIPGLHFVSPGLRRYVAKITHQNSHSKLQLHFTVYDRVYIRLRCSFYLLGVRSSNRLLQGCNTRPHGWGLFEDRTPKR